MQIFYFSWRYLNINFIGIAKEIGEITGNRYEISYSSSGYLDTKHTIEIVKNDGRQWERFGVDQIDGLTTGFIIAMGRALEIKLLNEYKKARQPVFS